MSKTNWETQVHKNAEKAFPDYEFSNREQILMRGIKAQDALCKKCLKGEPMLCSGIRNTVEYHEKVNKPIFRYTPCSKYMDDPNMERRKASSGIPISFNDYEAKSIFIGNNSLVYDNVLWGTMHRVPASTPIEELFTMVMSAIEEGYRAKFINFPVALQNEKNWRAFLSNNSKQDLLIIHRYDMGYCPEFISDYIQELVNMRKYSGLTTIFVMDEDLVPRNNKEINLIKEINTWEKQLFS